MPWEFYENGGVGYRNDNPPIGSYEFLHNEMELARERHNNEERGSGGNSSNDRSPSNYSACTEKSTGSLAGVLVTLLAPIALPAAFFLVAESLSLADRVYSSYQKYYGANKHVYNETHNVWVGPLCRKKGEIKGSDYMCQCESPLGMRLAMVCNSDRPISEYTMNKALTKHVKVSSREDFEPAMNRLTPSLFFLVGYR